MGDTSELLKKMEKNTHRHQEYVSLWNLLFSDSLEHKFTSVRGVLLGDSSTSLRKLSASGVFREYMEDLYALIRDMALEPEKENALKTELTNRGVPIRAPSEELKHVLRENSTFRSFLRTCVELKSPMLGFGSPFLYALGNKEDVDYIIANIPENLYLRNRVMLFLAVALERERIVDIPKVLGLDKAHVRDWWNMEVPGESTRDRFALWWEKSKASFQYTQSASPGQIILSRGLFSLTSFVAAPELDGAFFLLKWGFRGNAKNVYYFDFPTGNFGSLTGKTRDDMQGVYISARSKWRESRSRIDRLTHLTWNADLLRCEFNTSRDSRVGFRFSPDGGQVESV